MYYRAKYKNFSQTKEWNRNNYFKLSGGTLEVAMVSSNLIELPSARVRASQCLMPGHSQCWCKGPGGAIALHEVICHNHVPHQHGSRTEGRQRGCTINIYSEDALFFHDKDHATLELPI